MKIAVQMYTLRDFTKTEADLKDTLAKIGKIGYRALQMSAIGAIEGDSPFVSYATFKRMLDDHQIKCVSAHLGFDTLVNQTDAAIAILNSVDCNYVAIGGAPGEYSRDGVEGYRRFLDHAAPMIATLGSQGIRFGYHHHAHEFARFSESLRTLMDVLIDESPVEMHIEVDTYWAIHAGYDPVKLLGRLSTRCANLHVKDKEIDASTGQPVFAPIGEGNLNWKTILPAAKSAAVEAMCVEQDTCRRDPFDCLRSSYEFLNSQSRGRFET